MSRLLPFILPFLPMWIGCTKGGSGTETNPLPSGTGPTTESATDSGTAASIDTTHGALSIRYAFDGWASGGETCVALGTESLYLDLSLDGAAEPTATVACDDQPILWSPEAEGTWQIYLHTALSAGTAEGAWGASFAVPGVAVPGEVTDVFVSIVCQANGTTDVCG